MPFPKKKYDSQDKESIQKELQEIERKLLEIRLQEQDTDINELESIIEEEKYIQAYKNPYNFLTCSWDVFERDNFMPAKHLQAISEHLEACLSGQIKRLIVNIFPRAAKSALINKAFPTYCWIKKPQLRFANISYSDTLAVEGNIDSKKIIMSDWYKKGLNTVWKDLNGWDTTWEISKQNRDLQNDYYNTENGRRFSTSIGGTFLGKGADIIIIDDPISPKMADSDVERDKVNRWADQTMYSRLDDKINGVIILVQQRVHVNDMTGKFLEEGGWEHLSIPMEWDESKRYFTSIGWTDWRKKNGESVDPNRFPPHVIENEKKRPDVWITQYQQEPVPEGGGKIKSAWWNTYYVLPTYFDSICMAFDLNTKKGDNNDNTALVVVGRKDDSFYVIDLVYANMDITDQLAAIVALNDKYPYIHKKLIEDKSNGSAVWTLLNKTVQGLTPVDPKGIDKELRITASLVPKLIKQCIYLPPVETHPWVKYIMEESKFFPRGKHDDALDALAYSIEYLDNNTHIVRMPIEIHTETKKDYISRADAREAFADYSSYNVPITRSNNYIKGLFN